MSRKRLRGRQLQRRNKRFLQEHPLCVMCEAKGRVSVAEEVDHIIPLFKGGADEWENLQGLCRDCHAQKTAKDMGYQMGGWVELCLSPRDELHWKEKEFLRLYEVLSAHGGKHPEYLAGQHEIHNRAHGHSDYIPAPVHVVTSSERIPELTR